MPQKAEPSGVALTDLMAAAIKGMVARGDRKHDVAAFFGVNPGRVADVVSGRKFAQTSPLPGDDLPPCGPYLDAMTAWNFGRARKKSDSIH